jgi:hypothetical protein
LGLGLATVRFVAFALRYLGCLTGLAEFPLCSLRAFGLLIPWP